VPKPFPSSRLLPLGLAFAALAACGSPTRSRQVWFGPNLGSPDMIELFTQPERWRAARQASDVFKFYEQQLLADRPSDCRECGRNIHPELARAAAFTRVNAWGLRIAIEVGVIKSWGCAASATLPLALRAVRRVESQRAVVTELAMDEPLLGAESCQLSLEEAAEHTAVFARDARAARPYLRVGDIEPYPYFSAPMLLSWVAALRRNGFTPAFFHLDVDRAEAGRIGADVVSDLALLRASLEAQGIPFGVIFWSEVGTSDEAYFADVMGWVETVRISIGEPSHSIFQSWAVGPEGRLDVPANLPDASRHSHTRLLDEGLVALRGGTRRRR
jgi:hypothetical protein